MKHNSKISGTRLSSKAMKGIKGGFFPPDGSGCIPFLGACRQGYVCCNYSDGSPVYCSARPPGTPTGTCSLVA